MPRMASGKAPPWQILNLAHGMQQYSILSPSAPVGSSSVFTGLEHKAAPRDAGSALDFCTCFEQTLYFLSVVSVGLWFVWISWMPFLDWLVPPSVDEHWLDGTTTISDTFRRYSTVSTVYMTGPLSILFTLRLYRTFRCPLVTWKKKNVTSCLLLVQYSLYVIIRYDHIYGPVHGVFVFITVILLLYYHYSVDYTSCVHPDHPPRARVRSQKALLGVLCISCLFLFAVLLVSSDLVKQSSVYFAACLFEVLGIALLGFLDVIDIRNMRHD